VPFDTLTSKPKATSSFKEIEPLEEEEVAIKTEPIPEQEYDTDTLVSNYEDGQVQAKRDTVTEVKEDVSDAAEPEVAEPEVVAAQSEREDLPVDNFIVGGVKETGRALMDGLRKDAVMFYGGMAKAQSALLSPVGLAFDFYAEKLGIKDDDKPSAFKATIDGLGEVAALTENAAKLEGRGERILGGVAEGAGALTTSLPIIAAAMPTLGIGTLPLLGAYEASATGDAKQVAKQAMIGLVMQAGLRTTSTLPKALRIPTVGITFGAVTAQAGGDLDETIASAMLGGALAAVGPAGQKGALRQSIRDTARGIERSNWYRKLTIRERSLVRQSAAQQIEGLKRIGLTEGEILRTMKQTYGSENPEWVKAWKARGGGTAASQQEAPLRPLETTAAAGVGQGIGGVPEAVPVPSGAGVAPAVAPPVPTPVAPPTTVAEGVPIVPPDAPPILRHAAENIEGIFDVMSRSPIAAHRGKAVEEGKKDKTLRIEEKARSIVADLGKRVAEAPIADDEYTMKGYHVTRAEPFDAFRDDVEIPSSEGTYFWPTREAAEKVAGPRERIVEVDIKPGRQASPDQMGNFRRGEMSGEFDTAVGEGMFGPEIAVFNMDNIRIAGDEGAPPTTDQNAASPAGPLPKNAGPWLTNDNFNNRVDDIARTFGAKSKPLDIRREINRRPGMAERLNEFAHTKHDTVLDDKGKDITRRSLKAGELKEFAKANGIGLGFEDKGAAAAMIKAAHTADSRENAVKLYNEDALHAGRAILVDVEDAARGGAPLPETRYRATPEERDVVRQFMPPKMLANETGQQAVETILDGIDHPLPVNPRERQLDLNILHSLAKIRYRSLVTNSEGVPQARAALMNKAMPFFNNRYFWHVFGANMGNHDIPRRALRADLNGRRNIIGVEAQVGRIFVEAGQTKKDARGRVVPDYTLRRWISTRDDVMTAMKVVLNTSPKADAAKKAQAFIDGLGKKASGVNAIVSAYARSLSTFSAMNVRRNEVYNFDMKWNKQFATGETLGERYLRLQSLGKERTPTEEQTWGGVKVKVENMLPRFNDTSGDKPKMGMVSTDEMVRLVRGSKENGNTWLMGQLDDSNWGIRQNYMMTLGDRVTLGLDAETKELPGMGETDEATVLNPDSAINHRTDTGLGREIEGDIFAALYNHDLRLASQADSFYDINYVAGELDKAHAAKMIPPATYAKAQQWLKSAWGEYKQSDSIILKHAVRPGEELFWTFYALNKGVFSASRNIFGQGPPYGFINNHFRVLDVQRHYYTILQKSFDESTAVGKFAARSFASDISQYKAIYQQQMLNIDPGGGTERSRLNRIRIEKIHNLSSFIIGAPDSLNRRMGLVAYAIVDEQVGRFIDSQENVVAEQLPGRQMLTRRGRGTDKVDVWDALKVHAMAKGQQELYSKLFEDARGTPRDSEQWEAFKGQITRDKIVNINYDYRIQGGQLLKQSPTDRTIAGVITYGAGRWEEFYRNGIEPIWRAFDDGGANPKNWNTGQWKGALQGMQTIAKMLITASVASAVYGYVWGEKEDTLREKDPETGLRPTMPVYSLRHALALSPERPGYALTIDTADNVIRVMALISYGSEEEIKASLKWFETKGIQYSGVMHWIEKGMESFGNYNGVRNANVLQRHFQGMNMDARRTAHENFMYFITGGSVSKNHDPRRDLDWNDEIMARLLDGETMITPLIRKRLGSDKSGPRQLK